MAAHRQIQGIRGRISPGVQAAARGSFPAALLGILVAQSLVLVSVSAAVGTVLNPRTELDAPYLEALASGGSLPGKAGEDLLSTVAISAVAAGPFLLLYYGLLRPSMEKETVRITEGLRMNLGLPVRIFYGGIVEEILFRWGLMTTLLWVSGRLFGGDGPALVWAAIILSSLLFGFGHFPAVRAAGVNMTPMLMTSTVVLNLYGGVLFGWLYWQYGLLAAMIGHLLLHLLWYPFERRAHKRDSPATLGN